MIPTSLLKLGSDSANRAVKMFAGILKYLSEDAAQEVNTSPSKSARIDLVQKLLHQVRSWECCRGILACKLGASHTCCCILLLLPALSI